MANVMVYDPSQTMGAYLGGKKLRQDEERLNASEMRLQNQDRRLDATEQRNAMTFDNQQTTFQQQQEERPELLRQRKLEQRLKEDTHLQEIGKKFYAELDPNSATFQDDKFAVVDRAGQAMIDRGYDPADVYETMKTAVTTMTPEFVRKVRVSLRYDPETKVEFKDGQKITTTGNEITASPVPGHVVPEGERVKNDYYRALTQYTKETKGKGRVKTGDLTPAQIRQIEKDHVANGYKLLDLAGQGTDVAALVEEYNADSDELGKPRIEVDAGAISGYKFTAPRQKANAPVGDLPKDVPFKPGQTIRNKRTGEVRVFGAPQQKPLNSMIPSHR